MNISTILLNALRLRLSSFIAVIIKIAKKHKKHFVKAGTLILAFLLIAGSFFEFYVPTVNADDDNDEFCNMSFELYPEDETTEKSVILNGIMPKDASVLAAYDITITDGESEYQPDEDKPIQVVINDPILSEDNSFELLHIQANPESS